jgi:hypothetical protein
VGEEVVSCYYYYYYYLAVEDEAVGLEERDDHVLHHQIQEVLGETAFDFDDVVDCGESFYPHALFHLRS